MKYDGWVSQLTPFWNESQKPLEAERRAGRIMAGSLLTQSKAEITGGTRPCHLNHGRDARATRGDHNGPLMPPSLRMRQKCTAISTVTTTGMNTQCRT